MSKFEELLKKLQDAKIIQKYGDWEENIPENIWEEYFDKGQYKTLAYGLKVDTHRWYEASTTVVELHGGLLGITYVTNLFSESSEYADIGYKMVFKEMEAYTTVSYRTKPEAQND